MNDILLQHGIGEITSNNIKSIQRGLTTITSTTQNVAISAVDISKSVIIESCAPEGSGDAGYAVIGKLTSSTNIQFTCYSTANTAVSWQVIEFCNVKSLQTGDTTGSIGDGRNITISSVDTSKSLVFFEVRYKGNSGYPIAYINWTIVVALISSTVLYVKNTNSDANLDLYWQVIEFN